MIKKRQFSAIAIAAAAALIFTGCSSPAATGSGGQSAELKGLSGIVSVQSRYNLLFREHERELMPLCAEEGVGLLAYNLLAGGLLSGLSRSLRHLPHPLPHRIVDVVSDLRCALIIPHLLRRCLELIFEIPLHQRQVGHL